MKNESKSKTISDALRDEILDGKFSQTGRLPSEHQLMRRFAVARETVRAAIKTLSDLSLVDRRPGYGTFLADAATARAARKFAVIVPDAYHPFYARICRGIEEGAKMLGWATLSASLGEGGLRERAMKAATLAEMFRNEKVGGVFYEPLQFLSDGEKINRAILSVFDGAGIPVVLLDSDFVAPPQRSAYDLVGIDNTNAGYALARHVIAAGAKKIIYFSNPLPAPTSLKRGNGVGIAVTEAGLGWTRESVVFADPLDERAAKRMFAGPRAPDAIIAVNDYVALRLASTLAAIGLKVPKDVLLAGVNGDKDGETANPPLTTIRQPCEQIGRMAVDLMRSRLADAKLPPREVFISAPLVARESTLKKPRREMKAAAKKRK